MAYTCHIGSGQRLFLDNQAADTIVTLSQSGPGQQQQSTSRYQTGVWTSPPTVVTQSGTAIITVFSATGTTQIMVQGQAITLCNQPLDLSQAQPLTLKLTSESPPTKSFSPMPPLTMGNMEMTMTPMTMRMGNMELSFDNVDEAKPEPTQTPPATRQQVKQFCSQCGQPVMPTDRFCSHCGHSLQA